jgi:glycosyltransferase involved in cell wall biosynthesis
VCISNQTKDELVRLIPWRKKDISVIYQPISNKIKEVSSKNHTVPVILHIGTTPNKNLNKVIPALDGISCKLIIVGRLNEECLQLLKLHHIDYINKVDIPFSEIIKLYVECDIVTFPSSYEGQGLIVIEANATGRPVIAGDISVLHEVGGDSPYFVNPQNISEIRDAVLLILRNERLRNKKIRLGLENAKRFQVTEIMNQYKKIYQSVR